MILKIRQESVNDYEEVYRLNKEAFGRDNESKLVELLRKSDAFIPELSLVAENESKIVGHILFTKIKIIEAGGKEHNSLALAPMAVLPEQQNKGIGKKLVMHGLGKAKELGYKSVIVLGHKNYYPKFGFVSTVKWEIKSPFKVHPDYFMGLELAEKGLEGVTGTVQYSKEFEMVN